MGFLATWTNFRRRSFKSSNSWTNNSIFSINNTVKIITTNERNSNNDKLIKPLINRYKNYL